MTLLEFKVEVERRRLAGLDWIQLKVPGRMRGERKRVAPGLFGRALGEEGTLSQPVTVVDVKLSDVERWLATRKAGR